MATKSALVLTIPHSGTHFTMYLLCNVLGVKAEYAHFHGGDYPNMESITHRLRNFSPDKEVLVIPWRPEAQIRASWLARSTDRKSEKEVLAEYKDCCDIRDALVPLIMNAGFETLPIPKSVMRFQAVMRLADKLDVDNKGLEGAYSFAEEWPVIRGWDASTKKWIENAYYKDKDMVSLMQTTLMQEIKHVP